MNCWEFLKCGYEDGGVKASAHGVCPAYPHHGKTCAHVQGTHCFDKLQGVFAAKLSDCIHCPFYRSAHYDKSYTNDTSASPKAGGLDKTVSGLY